MTYKEFVANLAGMTVTGVKRKYDAPPQQVNAVDCPLMYPRLPEATTPISTFGSLTGLDSARCQLVVAINPMQQSTSPVNFDQALTIIDNLRSALATNAEDFGLDRWQIVANADFIGESVYWMVVATVEGSW